MSSITILVEYGQRRKKLLLNDADKLMQECKERFDIGDKHVVLEIMETEFSQDGIWIELDDVKELRNGSRVRLMDVSDRSVHIVG